jgi:hypothetical protein
MRYGMTRFLALTENEKSGLHVLQPAIAIIA